jgi:WS/DGAT/MGAT family acyltransferase
MPVISQTLTASDSAWWRLQNPTNPMTATAVLAFDERLEYVDLKSLVEDRLMALRRFRQQVLPARLPLGKPRWYESDDFALRHHLARLELDRPDDQRALETLVSQSMSQSLRPDKPLWRLHLIEEFGSGSALIAQVHQSVADGTSALRLLLKLAESGPDAAFSEPSRDSEPDSLHQGLEAQLVDERLSDVTRSSGFAAKSFCHLLTLRSERKTSLKIDPTIEKHAAWSKPYDLEDLQETAAALQVTVNELLLAAVSAAMRAQLLELKPTSEPPEVHGVIPLSLRPPGDCSPGSHFALALLPLPTGRTSLAARLRHLRRHLSAARQKPEALAVFGASPDRGLSMSEIEDRTVALLGKKASVLLSIAPGPPAPISFCGRQLAGLVYWPSIVSGLGINLSLTKYAGQVRLGVVCDGAWPPGPGGLIEGFRLAMTEIGAASD